MGFASIDDLVAEITSGKQWRQDWNKITGASAYTLGRWYDLTMLGGNPVAQTYSGTNLTFVSQSDTAGNGIWHGGNVSPDTKHLVNMSAFSAAATAVPSVLQLVDILGFYPITSVTTTTAQSLLGNGGGQPLPRYADGAGVRAFLVASAVMGAATPNISISYTNQAGVTGKVMPVTVSGVTGAIAGHIVHTDPSANKYGPFLPLAAGDTGIQKIDSITLSASYVSGSLALVLCKPLATVPIVTAGVAAERNLLTQLPSLPRIYDGANLGFLQFAGAATAANTSFFGHIDTAWG